MKLSRLLTGIAVGATVFAIPSVPSDAQSTPQTRAAAWYARPNAVGRAVDIHERATRDSPRLGSVPVTGVWCWSQGDGCGGGRQGQGHRCGDGAGGDVWIPVADARRRLGWVPKACVHAIHG